MAADDVMDWTPTSETVIFHQSTQPFERHSKRKFAHITGETDIFGRDQPPRNLHTDPTAYPKIRLEPISSLLETAQATKVSGWLAWLESLLEYPRHFLTTIICALDNSDTSYRGAKRRLQGQSPTPGSLEPDFLPRKYQLRPRKSRSFTYNHHQPLRCTACFLHSFFDNALLTDAKLCPALFPPPLDDNQDLSSLPRQNHHTQQPLLRRCALSWTQDCTIQQQATQKISLIRAVWI